VLMCQGRVIVPDEGFYVRDFVLPPFDKIGLS
jgi:hypothetical protein